ncbi:MAG: hypothetical protein AVDCRST_MAG75-1904 [uncultured Propionibacteriaceae bacterium]|uniref:Uncharacterized protein n=1 Tax=uncultured Propionibacteriaceae bacterium TaxID=257457 RepID=A0A6J4NSJ3_9ACTN|nr:MAG: hypothetical protein AVDCRST_MAG75-1904 [uncultured Propionibacteriaceae bacterium]
MLTMSIEAGTVIRRLPTSAPSVPVSPDTGAAVPLAAAAALSDLFRSSSQKMDSVKYLS